MAIKPNGGSLLLMAPAPSPQRSISKALTYGVFGYQSNMVCIVCLICMYPLRVVRTTPLRGAGVGTVVGEGERTVVGEEQCEARQMAGQVA